MAAINTGSILEQAGGENRTGTALSTNIIIEVNGHAVGAIRSLDVTEDRAIATIDEVGTDGHIDSAPQKSTDISGKCSRTRFDRMRIAEAFSRGFVHVHAQRNPFNIVIKDIHASLDDSQAVLTTIKNVWIKSISYTYKTEDFIIVEDMSWVAETIFSRLGPSQNNAVRTPGGGSRDFGVNLDDFERQADRGERRGALDAPGLLAAFLPE